MKIKIIETPVLSEIVEAVIGEPLENYIREKHNQDRCMGFIDGYEAATKVYTEEDLDKAIDWAAEEDLDKAIDWAIENGRKGKVTSKDIDNFIQSLNQAKNKQQ
jgi:hypothetical protein